MTRGLFVDMDGTIADSLAILRQVYDTFLANHGRQGSCENFAQLNGIPLRQVVIQLQQDYQLAGEVDDLLQEYRHLALVTYVQDVPPIAGAAELLQEAVNQGWRVGVVTSNLRGCAMDWLQHNSLAPWVTCVVGADSVEQGKPAPDPYLLALQQTGCQAGLSLAVEDSLTGARSALQAGLHTCIRRSSTNLTYDWPAQVVFVDQLQEVIPLLHSKGGNHVSSHPL